MARAGRSISAAERAMSMAVLALLCALAAWMLAGRSQLNPAVEAFLRAPALKGAAGPGAQAGAPSGEAAGVEAAADSTGAAAPGKTGLAALLPDDARGLKPLAGAESFSPATLSDRIDGKAELYLAAGFAAMACRSYQAGQLGQAGGARVEAYIYRMKTPDGAFAVFSGQRRPGSGQSGIAKNAYSTENALFFTSGADYVELIADKAGARAGLETLAKALLAKLGGGGEAGQTAQANQAAQSLQPPDLFPKAGLRADAIRLAVADAFGCQGLTSVYTAEYDASFSSSTAFLSRRKNAAEAAAQMELYRKFLTDNGLTAQTPAGAPAGAVVLAMEGMVEVLFTRGALFAGVHEAPDVPAALKLAAALDSALEVLKNEAAAPVKPAKKGKQ